MSKRRASSRCRAPTACCPRRPDFEPRDASRGVAATAAPRDETSARALAYSRIERRFRRTTREGVMLQHRTAHRPGTHPRRGLLWIAVLTAWAAAPAGAQSYHYVGTIGAGALSGPNEVQVDPTTHHLMIADAGN